VTAAANVRCMTPTCAWVGRVRPVRVDTIGLGAGVFGMLRLYCECRGELELELISLGVPEPVVARVPFKQP
jgi:hypothetical protein